MKQRVKLALAFYSTADIIFLDEPGTNLDRQAFAWYIEELAKLPAECLIFIASNNAEEYPSNAEIINLVDYKA
jgi:ABC-type multidrug transport system ATPase subunit